MFAENDGTDRLLLIIEQLELARELIRTGSIARCRAALVVLDNLAEILLMDHAEIIFKDNEGFYRIRGLRFNSDDQRRIKNDFGRKIQLASNPYDAVLGNIEPILLGPDATIFQVAHQYRNDVYHRGRHNPVLLKPLTKLYLIAVGRALVESFQDSLWHQHLDIGPTDPRMSELERFGSAVRKIIEQRSVASIRGQKRKLVAAVVANISKNAMVEASALASLLADDLELRVELVRGQLQSALRSGCQPEVLSWNLAWVQFANANRGDEKLHQLVDESNQIKELPEEDEDLNQDVRAKLEQEDVELTEQILACHREYKAPVGLKTMKQVRGRAKRLRSVADLEPLLRRYSEADRILMRLETASWELAVMWDQRAQYEIDIARGK